MPYLTFSSDDFSRLRKFYIFATNVLSRRNNLTEVYSLKLTFRVMVNWKLVKRLLNYAFSHNIQQLNAVVNLLQKDGEFPLSLFSSQSLKHLSLKMQISSSRVHDSYTCLTSTWELPALTTLELYSVTLCDDETNKCVGIFSKCVNLQNLILDSFETKGSNSFSIVHPRLSSLTLINGCSSVEIINVAAPQLKNLTIQSCSSKHVISAPDCFHSLEKVDICVSNPQHADAQEIVRLLQQIPNVRFLTLSLEIVEILISSMHLIIHQPSPFVNLKSLKIYPQTVNWWGQISMKDMPTQLKSYLLDGSPRSTFTIVFREEIKAQKIMTELGVILEKENDNAKTKGKPHVESHKTNLKKKLKNGGNVAPGKNSHWNNLSVQIEKARLIVSKLQTIENLVTKLPESNRAKIQPHFSSLSAETHIVVSLITDRMMTQCHEFQSGSSVCFHAPATRF